jgi:hypothetical protein
VTEVIAIGLEYIQDEVVLLFIFTNMKCQLVLVPIAVLMQILQVGLFILDPDQLEWW